MPYLNIMLIVLAVVLIVGLAVMTISLKKLILKQEPDEKPDKYAEVQKNDDHIKDFFDINTKKETKVSSFKDEFENEDITTGADFDSFYNSKTAKSDEVNQKRQFKYVGTENPEEEFKTVSFENNDFKGNTYNETNDETLAMDDDTQPMEQSYERPDIVITYEDGERSKIIKMTADQVTVGRGVGNDLLLGKNSFSSRNHAVFTLREGKLYLKDLNSKNGTFLNGEKIDGEVFIEGDCQVTFGNATAKVQIS